ncbi:unnamed protein product, partial [Effrenium voratum]
ATAARMTTSFGPSWSLARMLAISLEPVALKKAARSPSSTSWTKWACRPRTPMAFWIWR